MANSSKILYTAAKTTDDDDDEELAIDGGPATLFQDQRYQDTPPSSASNNESDRGDIGDVNKANIEVARKPETAGKDYEYHLNIYDDEEEASFSPVNLDDDDDENHDDHGERSKLNNQGKIKQIMIRDDVEDDRIYVGGGLGRHGSDVTCWRTRCRCCCFARRSPYSKKNCNVCKRPKTSKGPSSGNSPLCRVACFAIGFLALVLGSGYLGYEAGLPAEEEFNVTSNLSDADWNGTHHVRTKGEEWIEHPKDHLPHLPHLPAWHWNHTHISHLKTSDDPAAKSSELKMTNFELLHLSEHIFERCSERSILSERGRSECISLCHGHFCCFEKDAELGSCVSDHDSHCFAFAACENVIRDFEMNNVNTEVVRHDPIGQTKNLNYDALLNADDVKLLMETCDEENIKTLDGIKDCTAFCQHHLCCFSSGEGENCANDHPGECQAYAACNVLMPDIDSENVEGNNDLPSQPDDFDFAGAMASVQAACDNSKTNDDSWVAACHFVCADYLCCFSTDGTTSNCRDLYGDEVCDAYSRCGVLHGATDSPLDSQPETQTLAQQQPGVASPDSDSLSEVDKVNEVCTDKVQMNSALREQCRLACASRTCCFQEGPGNCFSVDQEWCSEFEACQVLGI